MFNAVIVGNLGRDAEMRQTSNDTAVLSFSVGANVRKGKEDVTVWVRCTLWGRFAETMEQYLVKGQKVVVTGSITTSEYETSNAEKRFSVECNVDKLELVGKKADENTKSAPPSGNDFDDDDALPF
jgi:single-strand DNA-binding protein